MIVKIKPGGSGDISSKTLEGVQDMIIRTQMTKAPLSIEENLLISLISEVIRLRKEAYYINEFDPLKFDSQFDVDPIELPGKKLSNKETEKKLKKILGKKSPENDTELEAPKEIRLGKAKKKLLKNKVKAAEPWLQNPTNRFWATILLVIANIVMFAYSLSLVPVLFR